MQVSDLQTDMELKALGPALTVDQKEGLKEQIIEDGEIIEPLVVWETEDGPLLVDGHNRLDIFLDPEVDVPAPDIKTMTFVDKLDAAKWILKHQLNKGRQLNESTAAEVRARLFRIMSAEDEGKPHMDIMKEIAGDFNVSIRSIQRDRDFLDAMDVIKDADYQFACEAIEEHELPKTHIQAIAKLGKKAEIQKAIRNVREGRQWDQDTEPPKKKKKPKKKERAPEPWDKPEESIGQTVQSEDEEPSAEDVEPPVDRSPLVSNQVKELDEWVRKMVRKMDDLARNANCLNSPLHCQATAACGSVAKAWTEWKRTL